LKNQKVFKSALNKKGITTEFVAPDNWISTGNYALNFKASGMFKKGIPNRRIVMYWGPKGAGKSYLLSLAALEAQKAGYQVVYIDTETAAESEYMKRVGLDLSEDKFTPIAVTSIEEATSTMSLLFQNIDKNDKIFVAFDSLSMMVSEKEIGDFGKGIMKGDQGQMAKKLKLFMKQVNRNVKQHDMFFVATGHAYPNQDLMNGKGTHLFSGGESTEFIPSISIFVNRLKLKDGTDISGIRIKGEVNKTRFTQAFQKFELNVPWDGGLSPIDGLLDMAVDAELVTQSGAWYKFTHNKKEIKFQRKNFGDYYNMIFDFDSMEEMPEEQLESEEKQI